MTTVTLPEEQQKLLDILKSKQREAGEQTKKERTVPKTVSIHASDLANLMWGSATEEQSEKVLGMVSKLIVAKTGIRQMRLTESFDEASGRKDPILWFRYSPVGKEKTKKLVEDQKALGRKRRQIFASDDEWELAVKAIEDFRNRNQQLPLN